MLDDDQKREEYQKLMHQLEEQYAKIDTANPTDWNVPNPEQENKALVSFFLKIIVILFLYYHSPIWSLLWKICENTWFYD